MNLGIILQARLGSKRLPNKSIKLINGKSLLDRCLENMLRVEISPLVTLLATTQLVEDDLLVSISNKKKS
jgi:spore coat polysaccharide biosynthesis protein SpsF (cytidylyltransferase family)